MKYKAREGVVLTKLCGMSVLIPTRTAFEHCRTLQRLPLIWAVTWEALEKGKPLDETVKVHEILTRKPREEVLARINQFYELLANKGFVIRCDDEDSFDAVDGGDREHTPEEKPL